MFIDWIPTVVKWLSLLSILFWLSVCFWTEVICQSSVACPLSLCLFLQIQSLNLDMAKLTIFSIPFIDILMFLWKTYWFYGAILFMTCPSYVVKNFHLELILVLGVWQSLIFKISHLQMSNYSRSIYLKVLSIKLLCSFTFTKK